MASSDTPAAESGRGKPEKVDGRRSGPSRLEPGRTASGQAGSGPSTGRPPAGRSGVTRRTGAPVTATQRALLASVGAGAVSGFALNGRDRQVCQEPPAWDPVVVTARVAALAAAGLVVALPDEVATGRWRWQLTPAGRAALRGTPSKNVR